MSGIFTYKPGLLVGRRRFDLKDGVLSETGEAGTAWTLPLQDVTRVAYAHLRAQGTRTLRLDLFAGESRRRLYVGTGDHAWQAHSEVRVFLELAVAILRALEGARPGLPVIRGEYGGRRIAMFVLGILSALTGLGIGVAALLTGVSASRWIAGAVPILILLGLGWFLIRTHDPRKPVETVSAGKLAAELESELEKGTTYS